MFDPDTESLRQIAEIEARESAQACELAIEDYARRTDFDRGRLSVMCVERKGDER